MKTLYVRVTNSCNLKCSHCYIKQDSLDLDLDRAIEFINKLPDDFNVIIHGGEPMMIGKDKLTYLSSSLKRKPAITTNLVYGIDDYNWFKDTFSDIATSWNYSERFGSSGGHFDIGYWHNNLSSLKEIGIPVTVLVTMTKSLIDAGKSGFTEHTHSWINLCENLFLEYQTGDGPTREESDNFADTVVDNKKIFKTNAVNCFNNVLTLNTDLTIGGCPNKNIIYGTVDNSLEEIYKNLMFKNECLTGLKNGLFPCYVKGEGLDSLSV